MKFIYYILLSFLLLIISTNCATTKSFIPNFEKAATSKDAIFPTNEKPKKYSEEDLELVIISPPPKYKLGKEKQSWLNLNELSPFNGIILNPEGIALILAEYSALRERSEAGLVNQRKSDLATLQLETEKLHLKINAISKKSNIIVTGKDDEIQRQQKINKDILEEKSNIWNDILLVGGAGVGGTLLGIVIGLLVHQ